MGIRVPPAKPSARRYTGGRFVSPVAQALNVSGSRGVAGTNTFTQPSLGRVWPVNSAASFHSVPPSTFLQKIRTYPRTRQNGMYTSVPGADRFGPATS